MAEQNSSKTTAKLGQKLDKNRTKYSQKNTASSCKCRRPCSVWSVAIPLYRGVIAMSNSVNVCPYYRGGSGTIVHCTGVERGVNSDLTFLQGSDRAAYCDRFCLGKYSTCDILGALDEAYRTCPHNRGVHCLQADGCCQCGWNPVVAGQRIADIRRRMYEWYRGEQGKGSAGYGKS